jgi:DNA-3-methyladenine glycosylase
MYINSNWLSRTSLEVAPDLIGCTLVRKFTDGTLLSGTIVETEAYGPNDPAMHAYRKRTNRNEVMFGAPGLTYIYLIYGLYNCLNIVTDKEGIASAVLIRALQLKIIPSWINSDVRKAKLSRVAAGPGKLCRTLKIDLTLNAILLQPEQALWVEQRPSEFQQDLDQGKISLIQTTRIGLTKGLELPWRWYLANCPSVSKNG